MLSPSPLTALAAVLPLAACGGHEVQAAGARRPPDVVLVVIDTLRADRLEPYGCERPTSPFLARLAREGTLCEDVTAQGSWTKPSVVSLIQGRYLTDYRDVPIEDSPTMAEVFAAQGYRTLGVVGNVLLSAEEGFGRGFEHYESERGGGRQPGQAPSRSGREVFDAARRPLDRAFSPERDGTRPPVFVWLHLMEPHAPYVRHPEYEHELPPQVSALDDRREYFAAVAGEPAPPEAWGRLVEKLACYDQEVRAADEWVRRLLAHIDSLGGLEHTLVAVVSDHGEGLWERVAPDELRPNDEKLPQTLLFGGHGRVVDRNLVATPMILWGAAVPAGRRVTEPVANVDLFPTLLELCGLAAPVELHGRSLVPALEGGTLEPRPMYSRVLQESSVRAPGSAWRLVAPTADDQDGRGLRLFDLARDPHERRDRAAEHPDVVADLKDLLEELAERYPTPSSLERERTEREVLDLRALGYAGQDGQDG